jgi:hypothetical protein
MKHAAKHAQGCATRVQLCERRGSTLIIVLALLGLLTLLGLVFYTFARSEHAAAEFFTEAAKDVRVRPDDSFEFGLETLLIGGKTRARNNVLGSAQESQIGSQRHAIVANLIGRDLRPGTGSGVNIIYVDDGNGNRVPAVDQNGDGFADPPAADGDSLLEMVDSQVVGRVRNVAALPEADPGYTYPDHNNMFLGYRGWAVREIAGQPTVVRVVIPSFMRPGLLRKGGTVDPTNPAVITDAEWYQDPAFRGRNFRPNPDHIYVSPDGSVPLNTASQPFLRFVRDSEATSLGLSGGFPFAPPDRDADGRIGELGIFTHTSAELSADPTLAENYELDVDTDGDGIFDAIWMDFDYPVQEDPVTGRKFTLMFSVFIEDMEGLINLNAHGNLGGEIPLTAPTMDTRRLPLTGRLGGQEFLSGLAPGRTGTVSRSNLGMSPSEINPIYALLRQPSTAANAFEQHQRSFGRVPVDAYELANMELFWLLTGRGQLDANLPASVSAITDIFPGRFGEPNRLFQFLQSGQFADLPLAGNSTEDDNTNVLEGVTGPTLAVSGAATVETALRGLTHPLDFQGSGRFVDVDPRSPLTQATGAILTPRYAGYGLFNPNPANAASTPLSRNQLHLAGADGILDTSAGSDDAVFYPFAYPINPYNHLFNDMLETTLEPERSQRPDDEPFSPSDTAYLHMQESSIRAAGDGVSERLPNLAPETLDPQSDIRSRFTTSSWRLKNHSLSVPFPGSLTNPFGPDGAPGWLGVDEDKDGNVDWIGNDPTNGPDMDEVGIFLSPSDTDVNGNAGIHTYSEDGFRAWEFNADTILPGNGDVRAGNNRYEFPPRYGRVPTFASRGLGTQTVESDGSISEDPFRVQLRRLLFLEAGDTRPEFGQLRLNLNALLDVERLPDRTANLLRGTLLYRNLTEHPDAVEAGALTTTAIDSTGSFPPQTLGQREFWARRDRQKMARDIYVMLYTLGGGNDNKNYTGSNLALTGTGTSQMADETAGTPTYSRYTRHQMREMAQFAVNVVDALDRDNVITKFEFDMNLGDTLDRTDPSAPVILRSGWNLDDNPDTIDGMGSWNPSTDDPYHPNDRVERGVVYGVERQSALFSEVLGILAPELENDHPATLYDDSMNDHAFLYVELQNQGNTDVPLATPESINEATAIYRIRRFNSNSSTTTANHDRIAFLRDAGEIDAGGQFVVAASDGSDLDINGEPRPADFYLRETDTSPNFRRIAPANDIQGLPTETSPSSSPALQPTADLDLVHMAHQAGQRFVVNGNVSTPGRNFMQVPNPLPPGAFDPSQRYVLVLERRQNPNMPSLTSDNDWVEVDRTFVAFRRFDVMDGETVAQAQSQLDRLLSVERQESLNAMNFATTGSVPNLSPIPGGMADPATGRRNTLGRHSGAPTVLWHQHFDRDFHSLGELLNIPLTGPASLTAGFANSMRIPAGGTESQTNGGNAWVPSAGADFDITDSATGPAILTYGHALAVGSGSNVNPDRYTDASGTTTRVSGQQIGTVSGANARFLLPGFPDDMETVVAESDRDNRWFRLFGMWEIATRTHRQLGNPLFVDRVPGPINLNTVRHPEVLAGVVDDPSVTDLQVDVTFQTNPRSPLPDRFNSTDVEHDWWHRLVDSRDGSFTAGHTLRIPGLPGSNPFRDFGYMAGNELRSSRLFRQQTDPSLNSARRNHPGEFSGGAVDFGATVLRTLEVDASDVDNDGADDNVGRRWLEVGEAIDHNGSGVAMTPMTRHRITSKVMNHANPVSHTFVMHMTIGAFEVVEETSSAGVPVFRIGPEYDLNRDGNADTDDHRRGVFVIDRSEFARAYDPGSRTFDWRRLIKHEVIIQ